MILQIIFAVAFFGIGAWFGYLRSEERFGNLMAQGRVMYKSPDFGWLGHPDAFKEIKEQEHEWNADEAKRVTGIAKKVIKRIKKDKK